MFLNRRIALALAVCMAFSASSVFAGGGGTKKDSTITVTNNTEFGIGVAVDPSNSLLASTTPEEFVARGGKILNPGDTYTVKVKAGSHRVIVVDDEANIIADANVPVAKGATASGSVTESGLVFQGN